MEDFYRDAGTDQFAVVCSESATDRNKKGGPESFTTSEQAPPHSVAESNWADRYWRNKRFQFGIDERASLAKEVENILHRLKIIKYGARIYKEHGSRKKCSANRAHSRCSARKDRRLIQSPTA